MQERSEVNGLLRGLVQQLRREEQRPMRRLQHICNCRIPIIKVRPGASCQKLCMLPSAQTSYLWEPDSTALPQNFACR